MVIVAGVGSSMDIGISRVRKGALSLGSIEKQLGPLVDFVALDVETANASRASICAVGIAVVHQGRVVLDGSFLVNPEVEFAAYNTAVNGITVADVQDAPTIVDAWPMLMRVLDGARVCAHNASFDIGALRSTAARYALTGPTMEVYCTWRIAKRVWPGLPSFGLGIVAREVEFPFDHHDAGQDALASAHVLLAAQRIAGVSSLDEFNTALPYSPGRLTPASFEAAGAAPTLGSQVGREDADASHPLYGKTLCFTGAMYSMVRHEAAAAVVEVGGNFKNSVSAKLDYLVVGDADYVAFADGWKTGKLRRAVELIDEGHPIEVIAERDFLALLRS